MVKYFVVKYFVAKHFVNKKRVTSNCASARNRASGFSMLELLLASSLATITAMTGIQLFSQVNGQVHAIQTASQAEASFHQMGHWLWRELKHNQQPVDWFPSSQCLTFGEQGVRVRNGALQWRPERASCSSSNWQSLHDISEFRIERLIWTGSEQPQGNRLLALCLEATSAGPQPLHWCYSG